MDLYPHQRDVLEATRDRRRVAYYLDMGLGKTLVGATKARELGNRVVLVVCQKSKIRDWVEQFQRHHAVDGGAVLDLTAKAGFEAFKAWALDKHGPDVVGVINYERAWRRPELLKLSGFTLMLDESSLIQNHRAQQSKFILKLKPEAVVLLSGTPTSGKYENLWTQAHLLGWDIKRTAYESQYVNFETLWLGGVPIRTVSKREPYKNVERLKAKLREHGAVFMKTEDVLEMPEQVFQTVEVPTTTAYRRFMKSGLVEVEGRELVGDTPLTKRLRARELCGHLNHHKLQAFRELVESTNERLVVFYNFTAELAALRPLVGERPVSIVNGTNKELDAYEAEPDSVTFVQYQAGAMGLNLQKARRVVYFTLPERSELFEQSKKRVHRIGQDSTCWYYVLTAEKSVEGAIYQTLQQRRDFNDELFRDFDSGV